MCKTIPKTYNIELLLMQGLYIIINDLRAQDSDRVQYAKGQGKLIQSWVHVHCGESSP